MKVNFKSTLMAIACSAFIFYACEQKGTSQEDIAKIKAELKEEMKQEQEMNDLKAENEKLKDQLAEEKSKPNTTQASTPVAESAPDKVKVRNADNAGLVLRTQPNDATKIAGEGVPHFFTGYIFDCIGTSGNYYKVFFEGGHYYIPKKYAAPYYGSSPGGSGPMRDY